MAVSSPPYGTAGQRKTLADVLAAGPLSLAAGLRCAAEIVEELRDLHEQARAYGRLTASSVILTESGAHLLPLSDSRDEATVERDIQAFGALLYQMLTGTPPLATVTAADVRIHGPRTGPSGLRPTATKLALRCLAPTVTRLSMQQVATEIRLLAILRRQHEKMTWYAGEPVAAPAPFLVMAMPPFGAPMTRSLAAAPGVGPDVPPPIEELEAVREKDLSPGETGAAPAFPPERHSFGDPTPGAPAKPPRIGGTCPKCDSQAIYVSRARSRFEQMLGYWNVPIRRCHRCYYRYILFGRLKISKDIPAGRPRRVKPRSRS